MRTKTQSVAIDFVKGQRVIYPEGAAWLAGKILDVIDKDGVKFFKIRDADFTGVFDIEASLVQVLR